MWGTGWGLLCKVPFVEKSIVSPLNCFCTFVTDQLAMFLWTCIWIVMFCWSVCILLTIPQCFEYWPGCSGPIWLSSLSILLLIYISMVIIDCYFITVIYFVAQIDPDLASGRKVLSFLEHFLTFWHNKMFQGPLNTF